MSGNINISNQNISLMFFGLCQDVDQVQSCRCRYCDTPLDMGDIYNNISKRNGNLSKKEKLAIAAQHGWTPRNRKHFTRELGIRLRDGKKVNICPECYGIWPMIQGAPQEFFIRSATPSNATSIV